MKKAFLPVIVFAKIAIRRAFRDKTAIFFIFLFPLIFLFVFGGIFGKSGGVSFRVALINESNSQFATQFVNDAKGQKVLKIDTKSDTLDKAKEKMSRSQIDAAIVLPKDFGESKVDQAYPSGQAVIYYTQNSEQAGQTLASVLQEQFNLINQKFVKTQTPFTVKTEQTSQKALKQFDYTFAGLLGFSIIGLGIFGPVNVFPELKKQGVLRRLHTTPLKVWQYFLANVLSQAFVGIFSILLMFAVAMAVFHLKVSGNPLELGVYIIFGIAMIFGIGMAIGGWAKDVNQAAPLSNIVVFPMLFLSGTFFPRFLMPEWLQKVSSFLPLTPVIDGIRLIATEGKHLTQLGPQLGLMAGWLVVVYIIAFRTFRWE
ncbi:MAG TPA: ABC transporter permease [Candidatus Saccharimonadales bacterium]|nr:ABC transporter permease [Candidatus Saccharimonadales bacterium]